MRLFRWARRYPRRPYAVPVRVWPPRALGHARVVRAAYDRHREERLEAYGAAHPTAVAAVVPRGRDRWRTWFVEDLIAMSLQLVRRHGPWVRERTGRPLWRQWLDMLALAVSLPAMPEAYYAYEWYLPSQRRRARAYLQRYQLKRVVYLLLAPPPGSPSLTDKLAFAEHARRCGIPVPQTLATVVGGELRLVAGQPGDALQRDMFVKPLEGKGGRGADRLRFVPGSVPRYGSAVTGRTHTLAEVVERLRSRAQKPRYARGFMLQELLSNHPDIAPLAGSAVSTCRIVTMLDERGEPEPIIAIVRMAGASESVVDNSHAGGMAAPVDLASGRLGEAAFLGHEATLERFAVRPDSGARIEGAVVPRWDEVVALALRAHRAFDAYALVGWDIAVTPGGPVLVEGNDQPCPEGLQRRHRLALGDHRFGALLAWHLRQRGVVP